MLKNDSRQNVQSSKMNWSLFWCPLRKLYDLYIFNNVLAYSLKTAKTNITAYLQGLNFIRCIKPNNSQLCDSFDDSFVMTQLENTGTAYLIENSENVKMRMLKSIISLIFILFVEVLGISLINYLICSLWLVGEDAPEIQEPLSIIPEYGTEEPLGSPNNVDYSVVEYVEFEGMI